MYVIYASSALHEIVGVLENLLERPIGGSVWFMAEERFLTSFVNVEVGLALTTLCSVCESATSPIP